MARGITERIAHLACKILDLPIGGLFIGGVKVTATAAEINAGGGGGISGFENDPDTTTGLTVGIKLGSFLGPSGQVFTVGAGTVEVDDFTSNQYVCVVTDDVTHMGEYFVSANADTHGLPIMKVSTDSGEITSITDLRTAFKAPSSNFDSVISGSSPVEISAETEYTLVTTGGTKGVEVISLAGNHGGNSAFLKTIVIHLSDNNDAPRLSIASSTLGSPFDLVVQSQNTTAAIQLIWNPLRGMWQPVAGLEISTNGQPIKTHNGDVDAGTGGSIKGHNYFSDNVQGQSANLTSITAITVTNGIVTAISGT